MTAAFGPRPGDFPGAGGPDPAGAATVTLQQVLFDAPGTVEETPELFWRGRGAVLLAEGALRLGPGAEARFDTWFNGFSPGRWLGPCRIGTPALELSGRGRGRLRLIRHGPETEAGTEIAGPPRADGRPPLPPGETLLETGIDLDGGPEGGPVSVGLGPALDRLALRDEPPGLIGFALEAAEEGLTLDAARITAPAAPATPLPLAICITTFRREAQVAATLDRLSRWCATCPEAVAVQVFVADNGGTLDLPPLPRVTVLANPNLGGAGGFARGMLAARAAGCSHVLFMDDDAACPEESIRRALVHLALARDPATAVAGAMSPTDTPWKLWEAGALFDRRCLPLHHGADLRDPGTLARIEAESDPGTSGPPPPGLYGGWWFFAFPLAAARHMPFPFFVRGDDVSFCLANPFRVVTLNGVVSYQDGFLDKESPLVWYLDLRSHLVHHLALPHMARGRRALLRMVVWFFLRNLVRFQYESMAAVVMALEDVTRGPAVFEQDPAAEAPRAALKASTREEVWREGPPPAERQWFDARDGWRRHLFRASLNGHLLPFFARWGNRVVLGPDRRSDYGAMWGAAEVSFLDRTGTRHYTTRVSRRRLMAVSLRLLRAGLGFGREYPRLARDYRAAYPRLTSAGFWHNLLGRDGTGRG